MPESEKPFRVVALGEVVGYSETRVGAVRKAQKAANDSGSAAFIETWQTEEQVDPKPKASKRK